MGKSADAGGRAVDGGNADFLVLLTRMEKTATGKRARRMKSTKSKLRVIVAGFGRFGQIAGRLLLSSG